MAATKKTKTKKRTTASKTTIRITVEEDNNTGNVALKTVTFNGHVGHKHVKPTSPIQLLEIDIVSDPNQGGGACVIVGGFMHCVH